MKLLNTLYGLLLCFWCICSKYGIFDILKEIQVYQHPPMVRKVRRKMSRIYERLKNEVLKDHAMNDYMQAEQMPLKDKNGLSTEVKAEYKRVAQQLTDDSGFPYEIIMWNQGNVLKSGYKPLKSDKLP